MKKVIFVINNFETGGVQKSLINLLKEIHPYYDIDLLTFWSNDSFEKELPENINVIKAPSPFRQLGLSVIHTKGKRWLYAERVLWNLLTRLFGRSFVIKLMCIGKKKYKGYDFAVSYIHEGAQKNLYGGCNEFVLKMVEAKEKITWLHCDFSLCGANKNKSKNIYAAFDKIIACSEGCRKAFLNVLPEFENKTVILRNCNDYDEIKRLAGNGIAYDKDCFNIVTVARLAKEKGVERALEAIKECVKNGYKVKYHIVGSGICETDLKKKVSELGIDENVCFYGVKENPYPYIKNADLFLLTSYHEAAPMVFDEASYLGVPIMATETTSTDEIITKTGAGFVCGNSSEMIVKKLLKIVAQPAQLSAIREEQQKRVFTNNTTVENFKKILY